MARRRITAVVSAALAAACVVVGVVTLARAPSQAGAACRSWAASHGYVDADHRFGKGDNCSARDAAGTFHARRTEAPWTTTFVLWGSFAAAVALGVVAALAGFTLRRT